MNFFSIAFNQRKASLVAQTINNLLAVQETRVWSLGQEDLLEKWMATPTVFFSYLFSCQVNSMDRGIWRVTVHMGVTKSDVTEWLTLLQGVVILEFSLKGTVYLADVEVYTSNIVQKLKG